MCESQTKPSQQTNITQGDKTLTIYIRNLAQCAYGASKFCNVTKPEHYSNYCRSSTSDSWQ